LYPLRSYEYDLSKSNIESGEFKVCLESYWKLQGCEGLNLLEIIKRQVDAIQKFSKGILRKHEKTLKGDDGLAQNMHFEEAQNKRIEVLNSISFHNYKSKLLY
jgi:excinuclease ABC subunit C